MTARIATTWNPNRGTDETKTTYSHDWHNLTNLEKADHLKDVIFELTKLYDEIVAKGVI